MSKVKRRGEYSGLADVWGRASSVTEFVSIVTNRADPDLSLFRGQRHAWSLVPKLGRVKPRYHFSLNDLERKLMEELRRSSFNMAPSEVRSEWDWLALAQHHCLPTRLLDWSRAALIALWFCVERQAEPDCVLPPVVWAFEPTDSDYATDTDSPYLLKKTKVFRPNVIARRIQAQSGFFTAHAILSSGKFLGLERNTKYKGQVGVVEIDSSKIADIRLELDLLGVSRATLFPDLDGLCRHVAWLHTCESDET